MKEDEVGETCDLGRGEREVTLNIGGDLNILGQGGRSDTKHWW
jgi:hypothetical protein